MKQQQGKYFARKLGDRIELSWRGGGQNMPSHAQKFEDITELEEVLQQFGLELTEEQLKALCLRLHRSYKHLGGVSNQKNACLEEVLPNLWVESSYSRPHRDGPLWSMVY